LVYDDVLIDVWGNSNGKTIGVFSI